MKMTTRLTLWSAIIVATVLPALCMAMTPVDAATMTGSCGKNLSCVQTFGKTEIDKRVAALNVLVGKVQANAYLTDQQKDTIQTDAKSNIPPLQALETKLMGETNIADARTDVRNIYVDFRIYAIVLPRDYHEIWLDHESNLHDQFVAGEPTINQAIQAASAKGINVAQEQSQYNDLVAKVTDAGAQITSAQNLIASLVPANFPGTTQTLATMRGDMKQAHGDLVAAAADLNSITQELKAAGAA
jgi:hypothetical protein